MQSKGFWTRIGLSTTCILSIGIYSFAQTEGNPTPEEVVIKAVDLGPKVKERKPPLNIRIDPYESVRKRVSESPIYVLLPELPFSISWRHSHPDFLISPRVVETWRPDIHNQGLVFHVFDKMGEALGQQLEANEAKYCQWTLSIVDEKGEMFQYYAGTDGVAPPRELLWNGRNDRGDWIQVGRSYSPLYKFVGPDGSQHTTEDSLLRLNSFVRSEADGVHISLDLGTLFGPRRDMVQLQPAGLDMLRSVADTIKLREDQLLSQIHVFGPTAELAKMEAAAISDYLLPELVLDIKTVTIKSEIAALADQRVEISLKNRPKEPAPTKKLQRAKR